MQGKADYMEDIKEKKGIREGHKVSRKKKKKGRKTEQAGRKKGGREGGKEENLLSILAISTGPALVWALLGS